jgi:hypothetical protein
MWCHTIGYEFTAVIIGRVAPRTEPKTDSRLAARLAALASLGAAVIHFTVVPTHWHEWMPAGVFFVALASFQLIWAAAVLVRATTPFLAAGIALNVAAIAVWALSRTAGTPFGPHAGDAEVMQAADLCALLLQIYVVMGAAWVWHRGLRGEPVTAFASAVVLLGAVGVVALASTVGVASGLRHDHDGPAGAGPDVQHADSHHGDHPHPLTSAPVEKANGTPAPPSEPPEAPAPPATPLDDAHETHEHRH